MNILLISAIILAVGVAILMSCSLQKILRQKKGKDMSMQTLNTSVEYIDPWEQQKEMVSTEKIKQMKEELERKHKNDKVSIDTNQAGNVSKENEELDGVLQAFKDIRAGEVQRNGQEQFNLRKDETSSMAATEEGTWWL